MDLTTSTEKRVALLKELSLLNSIPPEELTKLATLFHDAAYPAGQVVVKEHDTIDSIYVIVDGRAEVTRLHQHDGKENTEILALLSMGETIGLDETGFFSESHQRTATVTAITTLITIRLELSVMQQFLQSHTFLPEEMQNTLNNMLIHDFIKKIEPFEEINPKILHEITPRIKTIEALPETILFNQGDVAECCYLLCSGTVDVRITIADGCRSVATIEPGELIGEMALFTDSLRNATLKTITACKLLVIQKKDFQKLIEHADGAPDALTEMLMDRHRALQCEGISIHTRTDSENITIVILKNAELGTYIKTSVEGLFVWNLLDGEHTLQDIALAYFYQFRKLAVESIGNLILHLMQSGFVKTPLLAEYVPQKKPPRWISILAKLRSIMQFEYSIHHVDDWITRLYQKGGYLFFTRPAKLIMALITLGGLGAFIAFFPHVGAILKSTSYAWLLLILVGPANCIAVPLHELAHALTTKAYGYQVHRLGVGWFWLGPMAFADTSDMWLSGRGPRTAVNLSGIYVNCVFSGLLALIAWCLPYPIASAFIWLVAFSSYLMAFYNLDPMFELDGYYVLMDAVDKPNLRTHAITWLLQDSKRTFKNLTLIRQFLPEILYWTTSIAFIFIATAVAFILQTYVLNNILLGAIGHTQSSHYNWILSLVVLTLSFASLYSKVKHQIYLTKNKIMKR